MSKRKLKLEDVEIESFATARAVEGKGTVEANEMETVGEGTCMGQTGACTACPPLHCY
ncbi:hypothetical protein [Longimicrobium terrae]|uniref:Uncharacterized protein n=1 Tax=Longimicrobium terrae TaxID=1639882 RepID=A0A841H267_9BACT|nr:hypothetical protein [Longimicrobium terrae]MBB4637629.1 hypothetical protein [Longimicrobium terrae]MBB6072026.1 hypothetical protein [Longimicrobium terrae]NNC29887.1 hypothetical protein [Longimicrobium terrae]